MFWFLLSGQAAAAASDGCIGQPLRQCLAHMHAVVGVDESQFAGEFASAAEKDVNGKPIGGADLLYGSVDVGGSSRSLKLQLDALGNVSTIELSLASSPQMARTEKEYEATGLAPVFKAVLPKSCAAVQDDMAVYRFFENVMKPAMEGGDKRTDIDETHASTNYSSGSAPVPICGVNVRFSSLVGYDTSFISEYNDHGFYQGYKIEFSSRAGPNDPARERANAVFTPTDVSIKFSPGDMSEADYKISRGKLLYSITFPFIHSTTWGRCKIGEAPSSAAVSWKPRIAARRLAVRRVMTGRSE